MTKKQLEYDLDKITSYIESYKGSVFHLQDQLEILEGKRLEIHSQLVKLEAGK